MDMFRFAISHDWPVLAPIFVCSIVALAVTLERYWTFGRNRRGVRKFLDSFRRELTRGIPQAQAVADSQEHVVGRVASEGVRIMSERPEQFESLFDVTTSLATRDLERNLTILGTIATISPYLGLFGTVVRILITFGELAQTTNNGSASIMMGIGSALIATAVGLAVAIYAVTVNNYFHQVVERFSKDFELVKLILLSTTTVSARPGRHETPQAWAEKHIRI